MASSSSSCVSDIRRLLQSRSGNRKMCTHRRGIPLTTAFEAALGWRLAMGGVDPKGIVELTSEGGPDTHFPQSVSPTLPGIFAHRDVGNTACPGDAGYASLDQIRDIAARFNDPPSAQDLADSLQGGAIYARWQAMGGMKSPLGAPTSPESCGQGATRYVTFEKGAIYWSPATGPPPSPAPSMTPGPRWALSRARSACRPVRKSKSRCGSCRISSTAL
jgi:uncharacterized protein with LGFP repeats